MSDRPDAWGPRRSAWRIERLEPSLDRLPGAPRAVRHARRPARRGPVRAVGPGAGPAPASRPPPPTPTTTPAPAAPPPSTTTATRCATAPAATPTRTSRATWACPASRRSPAASTPPGTARGPGRCGCSPASAAPRTPTPGSASCSTPARRASRSPTTCPPSTATTPTTPRPRASSGRAAWPSAASPTWRSLLAGLPLDRVSTSMTINAPAAPIWAMYIVAAEKAGVPAGPPRGHDPERHPQGVRRPEGVPVPAGPVDAPGRRTRSSSGRARCRAGTPSRSAATTSARRARRPSRSWRSRSPTAWPTWRRRSSAACAVDDFAPRLSFFFNSHSDFFEEIAKFRASRRIWWKLMSERYRAENERSTWMRFHTQTAGVSLTPQQPLNNLTRVATQALAAILGGTQSLHTDAYDEALAVPTAEAALLALRQQQVIFEETGVASTVDPLGGSWFVESLTNRVGARGLALPRRDRPAGRHGQGHRRGLPAARDRRLPPTGSSASSTRASGRSSASTATSTRSRSACPVLSVPEGSQERHLARLERTRAERDGEAVGAALRGPARGGVAARDQRDEPHAALHPLRGGVRDARRAVPGAARGLRGVPGAGLGLRLRA